MAEIPKSVLANMTPEAQEKRRQYLERWMGRIVSAKGAGFTTTNPAEFSSGSGYGKKKNAPADPSNFPTTPVDVGLEYLKFGKVEE